MLVFFPNSFPSCLIAFPMRLTQLPRALIMVPPFGRNFSFLFERAYSSCLTSILVQRAKTGRSQISRLKMTYQSQRLFFASLVAQSSFNSLNTFPISYDMSSKIYFFWAKSAQQCLWYLLEEFSSRYRSVNDRNHLHCRQILQTLYFIQHLVK